MDGSRMKMRHLGWSMLLLLAWISPSHAQTLRYTNADIYPVARFLNERIAEGDLQSVSSGLNRFAVMVPGRKQPVSVQLRIPVIKLKMPGLYAQLRIQSLRFRRFSFQFDGERQALRLRIYFHNQKNGIVGYYKMGPMRHSLRLHVKRAMLNVYLKPQIQEGILSFAPLEAELSFYEGNMPRFIRPVLFRAIEEAITASIADLQRQFEAYRPELIEAIRAWWPPAIQPEKLIIEEGHALLLVR